MTTTSLYSSASRNASQNKSNNNFTAFYDRNAAAVYGYIKKILIKEDLSNETLVEVFINAWSVHDKFGRNELCEILKIARKETNKRRINIILQQIFAEKKDQIITLD